MTGKWLCPEFKKVVDAPECSKLDCGKTRKRCPIFNAFLKEREPAVWEKKMGVWNKITVALLSQSVKILDRDKAIDFRKLQEDYALCKGLVIELNIPDAHFRAYFYIKDGHPAMLTDAQVDRIDAVIITSYGCLRQLFSGSCTVYDYKLQKWVNCSYDPQRAWSWNHLNIVRLSTDKDVLSSAYLFSKELYHKAFPILKSHMKRMGML